MSSSSPSGKELASTFNPADIESSLYSKWLKADYFTADASSSKEAFTIVLPPPNVTGVLHIGHALDQTLQDCLTRMKRMQGYETLWLPGMDHAGIATQNVVEKQLAAQGLTRHDLGREEFVKKVWEWKAESGGQILGQMKRLGDSVDWTREAFTLDEKRTRAVRTVFKSMYDDGLIYRGHRIVNWDPKGQTTISDDEIVYEERDAVLYTFRYSQDFPIAISTTRPETKVGDVAVGRRQLQFVQDLVAQPLVFDREAHVQVAPRRDADGGLEDVGGRGGPQRQGHGIRRGRPVGDVAVENPVLDVAARGRLLLDGEAGDAGRGDGECCVGHGKFLLG